MLLLVYLMKGFIEQIWLVHHRHMSGIRNHVEPFIRGLPVVPAQ